MRSARASLGALMSGLAAVVLAVDTWQPWYALRLPVGLLDQVDALSRDLGSFGSYVHAGVAYAREAGPIPLTAHDVFHVIDVLLVLIAVGVVAMIVAGLTRERPVFSDGDGNALAGLGGIAFCLIGYRIVDPPAPSGLLTLRPGIWIGLAAAGLIGVGGLLSREPAPAVAVAAPPVGLTW